LTGENDDNDHGPRVDNARMPVVSTEDRGNAKVVSPEMSSAVTRAPSTTSEQWSDAYDV